MHCIVVKPSSTCVVGQGIKVVKRAKLSVHKSVLLRYEYGARPHGRHTASNARTTHAQQSEAHVIPGHDQTGSSIQNSGLLLGSLIILLNLWLRDAGCPRIRLRARSTQPFLTVPEP